jgi:hypothetical protein
MTPIWSPEAISDLAALRVYIEQMILRLHNASHFT